MSTAKLTPTISPERSQEFIEQEREKYKNVHVSKHFPMVKQECKEAAVKFFYCFSKTSQMLTNDDVDAARRGLYACQAEMKPYDECMERQLRLEALKKAQNQK